MCFKHNVNDVNPMQSEAHYLKPTLKCYFVASYRHGVQFFFSGMFLPSRACSTKYIYILLNSDVCLPCSVLAILLMILKVIQNKGCKEIINIKMWSFCFHDSDFTVLVGVDWKSEQRAAWSTTDPARVVGDRCGATSSARPYPRSKV